MRQLGSRTGGRFFGFAVASLCAAIAPLPAAQAQECPASATSNASAAALDAPIEAYELQAHLCSVNIETARKTIGVQATMMMPATFGLTGAIMGRLDSERGTSGGTASSTSLASLSADGRMALGAGGKSRTPAPAPEHPFTVYAVGSFLGGTNPDTPHLAGYTYDTGSATFGLDYSVNRNLILGLAGNTATTSTDLNTGAAVDISTIHAAAYLSYATRQVFLDALAAYGGSDLDVVRPVLTEVVRSSTDANVLSLAVRGGYLFDLGKVRAGPVAGLTYVHGRIDGYTETGPADLIYTVSAQSFDLLTGGAGIRLLAPFQAGGHLVVPYVNVTWEHQFGNSARSFAATLTQTALPVPLSYPAFDARDYGKVEGGLTYELTPSASVSLGGASTFAGEGHDFRISAGLNYRF